MWFQITHTIINVAMLILLRYLQECAQILASCLLHTHLHACVVFFMCVCDRLYERVR